MATSRNVLVLLRRVLSRPGAVAGDQVIGGCERGALKVARGIAGPDGTVTVCTVGRARREEKALQEALKGFANRAIRVSDSGADRLDYLGVARVVARVVDRADQPYDAIVCGDRSEDCLSGAVGPAVAELMGLPHLTGIVDVTLDDGVIASVRSTGQKLELKVQLPAVLCIRDCARKLPDAPKQAQGAVETLSFRDLDLGTKELAPRTRLEGVVRAVRTGSNAAIAENAHDLLALLAEDHLL
jgi:electron transfer flavoprotein alpha/beta subunit